MWKSLFQRFFLCSLSLVGISASSAIGATVETAISDNRAYVGVPVSLFIRVNNAAKYAQPTLPEVDGLKIESSGVPSQSSQTTIINGRRTGRTSVTYRWALTPRQPGSFVIPSIPVRVDGGIEYTQPVGFRAVKSETGDLLYVEVDGKQDKIYVGESLDLTLRVLVKPYHDGRFDITLSPNDMWDLISQQHTEWGAFQKTIEEWAENRESVTGERILRSDAEGEDQVYYAYKIPATIYPTRPGQVDTGDVQVVLQYPTALQQNRGFFSSGGLSIAQARPLVENAKVPSTRVIPVPEEGRPVDYRGAVGQYEMITRAHPRRVKAGDPITLNIGIRGDGPMELVQSPPLSKLSAVTEKFKVPDELLAGVVEGDVKVFSVDIRPRTAGIYEIPALPLSFFNPGNEKYETVYSEPISIEVDAADQLALSSVVSSSAPRTPTSTEESSSAIDSLVKHHHRGNDLLIHSSASATWPVVLGLSWAPALFLMLAMVQFGPLLVRRWIGGHRLARKQAEQALQQAATPEEVCSLLLKYIAALAELPAGSLTRVEAVRLIRGFAAEETVNQLDHLLAECEVANYAGASNTDIVSLKQSAIALLQKVGTKSLSVAPPRNRFLRTAVVATAMCSGGMFGLVDGTVTAADLSEAQQSKVLQEASDAYQLGLESSADVAVAKEAFSSAAQKYQLLVDKGIRNAKLYSNLAAAYLQSGKPALGLVNFERALAIDPGDQLGMAGRDQALFVLTGEQQEDASLVQQVRSFNARLPWEVRVWAGISLWSALWVALAASLYRNPRVLRKVATVAALGCVLCVSSLGLQTWCQPSFERGVVVAKEVPLREGNGEGFAVISGTTLPEGSRFEVVEKRGNWIQVRTFDGIVGWLSVDTSELIESHNDFKT